MRKGLNRTLKLAIVLLALAGLSVLLSPSPTEHSPYASALSSLSVVSDALAAKCTHVYCSHLTYCTQGDNTHHTNCIQGAPQMCRDVAC